MIRVTSNGFIRAETDDSAADKAHHYTLAERPVVFQSEVEALANYGGVPASERFSQMLTEGTQPVLLNADNARLHYHGSAAFNREFRKIDYWLHENFAQIDIEGKPICSVDLTEESICLLNDQPFDERLNLEVATGPALITLLAKKETYCLHAGAVATPAGNIGIIGESGVGKSTLSRYVDRQWRQISDDILPIRRAKHNAIELLPDFPQLKLDNATVFDPLAGAVSLDFLLRVTPEPNETVVFNVLKPVDALLQIVRHTAGAKLFNQHDLRQHVKFAQQMTFLVPVIELSYPREISQLPALREQIVQYLSATAAQTENPQTNPE